MKKALIVIDVQKYFCNKDTKHVVEEISKYLRNNRNNYDVVLFTIFKNDSSSPLWNISKWKDCTKSPDTDICNEIKEFTDTKNLFYKNILSAYKVKSIARKLREQKITEVHLCGFDTDCCVLATAYDLFDDKIKPVILENLTYSTSKDKLHKSALQMIERNIGFVQKV